jgi:hypothetical protein
MANSLTQNPLQINTTATIAIARPILARRIEWYVPLTVGATVIAGDLNGNILFEGTCEVSLQSQILWTGPQKLTLPGKVGNPNGSWQVSITSGTLLIWF